MQNRRGYFVQHSLDFAIDNRPPWHVSGSPSTSAMLAGIHRWTQQHAAFDSRQRTLSDAWCHKTAAVAWVFNANRLDNVGTLDFESTNDIVNACIDVAGSYAPSSSGSSVLAN